MEINEFVDPKNFTLGIVGHPKTGKAGLKLAMLANKLKKYIQHVRRLLLRQKMAVSIAGELALEISVK